MSQTEACCFRDDSCLELSFEDCLNAGGLPMGVGTSCEAGSVGDCSAQACCYPDDACLNQPPRSCIEYGGTPLGRGVRCEAIADLGCNLWGIEGDCCLPDGTRISRILAQYCEAIRGHPVGFGEACPPPAIDEDCRGPEADVEVGPIWSLELCARTTLHPAIAGEDVADHKPGYGVLVTDGGVRNRFDVEPCQRAATSLFLDARGYGQAVFCSQQPRNPGGVRAHEGAFGLQAEGVEGPTKPGYGVYLAAYDAPDWSETIVGSLRMRCFGPEN